MNTAAHSSNVWNREYNNQPNARYFIVRDGYPNDWELMFGNPDEAIGWSEGKAKTIKALVAQVPADETVYRVYLARTDGKTGKKVIRQGEN